MFTRCPGCKSIHRLDAALLAQGNGLYRCGQCNKVSNALQNLFDSRPKSDQTPTSSASQNRQPPVLNSPPEPEPQENQEIVAALFPDPPEAPDPEVPDPEAPDPEATDESQASDAGEDHDLPALSGFEDWSETPSRAQRGWAIAAGLMMIVTVLNLFFLSGDALVAQPTIRAALEGVGAVDPRPEPTYRDLDLLHLASSEMNSHPTLDETLVLNATIVNRADRTQPFPALQVTLFDAQNQPLASRIFAPAEYLPANTDAQTGMSSGAYLPVIMELLDPGKHAVGFEMKFH